MHSCTLLVLHSIQAGQLCMWVPRSWASSTLSSRNAVPSVHTAIFALFSGQGSPVGGNCSVVLVLHSLSSGAACVQSSGCLKQHPAVLTESVSGWRGSLYAFYSTLLFLLSLVPGGVGWGHATVLCRWAREPGWNFYLLFTCMNNINNGTHWFLRLWVLPSALQELSWFPNIMQSLLLVVRLFNWLTVVSQEELL